jgi:TatD DNase family protein
VLARMQTLEMGGLVVGTDYAESVAAIKLAEQQDFLWASVGLHPNDNLEEMFDAEKYFVLAQHPKVVAIGECGLDYFRSVSTDAEKTAQKKRFKAQIELAFTIAKPLIIHCREAHEDMLAMLKDYMGNHQELKVIIHFFTGTGELAKKYLDLGCYLSFPGPITYTDMYDESIKTAPLNKILSETDSPFAAPVPHRGKRNEPAFVEEVVKKIASVKGVPVDEIARHIVANAQQIFRV